MLSGVLRLIANRLLLSSPSSKACQKSGPFPPPELPGFIGRTNLSDSRSRRRPSGGVWGGNPRAIGPPPMCRVALSTCRAHTPADPNGCTYPVSFPVRCSLPRYTGGSASASLLSRPAQASLTLRPVNSLSRPRRPLSQGFSPPITRISCLSATRPNRLLSRWSLPPPATRPCGAHSAKSPFAVVRSADGVGAILRKRSVPVHWKSLYYQNLMLVNSV